jgi:hypothetical protein
MRAPTPTYMSDFYRFAWPEEGVQIDVTRLDESKTGLFCELDVSVTPYGVVRQGRFNLSAPNTRAQWKRDLEGRYDDIDWYAALEAVCQLTVKHWREGEPAVDLREVDLRARPRWLYAPYVEHGGPSIFFADGGSGKSMLALALAVSISTGRPLLGGELACVEKPVPVLYLDWETDSQTHAARLRAICAGADPPIETLPPIFYQRMSTSLVEGAASVRRRLGELSAGFVIVDSIGPARGGVTGDGSSETIRLHNAGRGFNVPWIGVDHITKSKEGDKTKPFGSVYEHNLARLTWSVEKAPDSSEGKLIIALTNHKANNGRLVPRRGYNVTIEEDAEGWPLLIRYDGVDVRDVPGFVGKLSQRDQLVSVLKGGALTDAEVVAALAAINVDMTDATIRALLSRYKDIFTRVYEDGNRSQSKIGLLVKAYADG